MTFYVDFCPQCRKFLFWGLYLHYNVKMWRRDFWSQNIEDMNKLNILVLLCSARKMFRKSEIELKNEFYLFIVSATVTQ